MNHPFERVTPLATTSLTGTSMPHHGDGTDNHTTGLQQ